MILDEESSLMNSSFLESLRLEITYSIQYIRLHSFTPNDYAKPHPLLHIENIVWVLLIVIAINGIHGTTRWCQSFRGRSI